MSVIIQESDMQFGEYCEEDFFHIEASGQYREHLLSSGVKSCEFILRKGKKLLLVEAKKTCPKQIAADTSEEKKEKYEKYIQDISTKMRHSLALYANILLERYSREGIPVGLKNSDLSSMDMKLVLVVKNAEKSWLEPFPAVLKKQLQDVMSIWKIRDFIVMNEEMAKRKKLVV